jgi:glycosyltransferase involved in cell wall biosynthesis
MKALRIAQIAPLIESVPPRLYGGTERIVSYLTEELVAMGHDVTLFASGDSITGARLTPICHQALRLNPAMVDPVPYYMLMLKEVRARAREFDVLHFHIDQFHFPLFSKQAGRTLTTLHGRQDLPDLKALYRGFPEMPLVSISNAQRTPIADGNFAATVLHGIPEALLPVNLHPRGGYLAFLGRVSDEKGVDRAIEIARAVGMPLKIAAKVDAMDETYYTRVIKPLLRPGEVEFIGEIDERRKAAFLGNARALLFPIRWPEPFGVVMIEAMACGTPVLAFREGSVPEVIDEGVSGLIVASVPEAVRKMGALLNLDRGRVRRQFEARFTARRMAEDYVQIYRDSLTLKPSAARASALGTRLPDEPTGHLPN